MITITWYKAQLKEGRFIASVAAVSFPFLGDRKSVRVSGRAGGGWDLNAVMFSSRVFLVNARYAGLQIVIYQEKMRGQCPLIFS